MHRRKKTWFDVICILSTRGSNEQHTFNMSRGKMSWKVFILVRVCVQQQQPFKERICAIRFGVQEHLVLHGNRVNRKLNFSLKRRAFRL